jgi:hypothetical protein
MRKVLFIAMLAGGTAGADTHTWGIGIRATHAALQSDSDVNSSESFRGGGLQVRYRAGTYWGFELAVESMSASFTDFSRKNVPLSASTQFHVLGRSAWDLYLVAGVGHNADTATFRTVDRGTTTQSAGETTIHLGAGIERALGPFGIGLELRAYGLHRSGSDGPSALPVDASGHSASLTCTYYF